MITDIKLIFQDVKFSLNLPVVRYYLFLCFLLFSHLLLQICNIQSLASLTTMGCIVPYNRVKPIHYSKSKPKWQMLVKVEVIKRGQKAICPLLKLFRSVKVSIVFHYF